MAKKKAEKEVTLTYPAKTEPAKICPVTGSVQNDFSNIVANQAINTAWLANSDVETKDRQIKAVLAGMVGIAPQDEIEGMLAAQMVAAHNASMECFRRAMISTQTLEGRRENLSQANKLTRSYTAMMEALSRYRGKGQQKMTVEHVHVHPGGQAIVGNVTQKQGGGITTKNEEQPHAKQITHAPDQTLSSANPERQPVPISRND